MNTAAVNAGGAIALDDGVRHWAPADLQAAVAETAALLHATGTRVLATLLDNGAPFVALDEAAAQADVVHVPLPLFFTPEQQAHALRAAGVDTLVVAAALARQWPTLPWLSASVAGEVVALTRLPAVPVALPVGTAKVTFTSGSTGAPKGVCLSADAMQRVARGLVEAMAPLGITRHLNALPFAVLLENIAGLMAPRLHGATVITRPLASLGLGGASQFDARRFDDAVRSVQPHSLILLPQMLRAWCAHLQATGQRAPAGLKLVAVGGATVGAPLVRAAHALGIPVGEGYGLSEGASVQTLNLPGNDCPGSAGRVLPHARLRVADDGELLIGGALFSGYLGDPTPVPYWWPTGDLGRFDEAGFVHVLGRKTHLLITAYGRNVSPEWVETALRGQPAVLQAIVFGDAQPALSAVLWPVDAQVTDSVLQAAVDAANTGLPDYARIATWVRGSAPFDTRSGYATANGRPQRAAIQHAHAAALGLVDLPATELA